MYDRSPLASAVAAIIAFEGACLRLPSRPAQRSGDLAEYACGGQEAGVARQPLDPPE
jgi:hypothetical protein